MLVKILIAVLIFIALFGFFIGVFILNKKVRAPKDCAKDDLPEGCASCMMACHRRENQFEPSSLLKTKKNDEEKDETTANESEENEE